MSSGYLDARTLLRVTEPLIDSQTGVINPPEEALVDAGSPEVIVYSARVSMLERTQPHISLKLDDGQAVVGSGSSTERELAKAKAICESLERYCNYSFDERRVIVASRDELGEEAMDLRRFPRGRPAEYPNGANIGRNDQPIRWVRGYSLTSAKPLWVPFGAAYISSPYAYLGEAFTQPITTGTALAASYARAAVTAILELVERDTLTLTWLHQMPLPRIDISACRNPDLLDRLARTASCGIETLFFDGTTDFGLPTAYALQWQPDGEVAMLAMAATRFDMESALIRVLDEAASSRVAIASATRRPPAFNPEDYRSFTRLSDGAVYYADAKRRQAFDFLLNSGREISLTEIVARQPPMPDDAQAMLDHVLGRFRALGYELAVVDLSAGPVADCGLVAVHVVAPDLLPLTVNYNLKYGDTPRLYQAPARMGHAAREFEQLNPWPQPFA